ncbi:MAG: hypothetical protein QOE46_1337 [Acidobacteriota bacterium]|jgi:hypothetical protein|nr:hypothetical protein [Acidobacteriota bacterium]
MLDVKQAAQTASTYFADLYAQQGVSDVRLEEVEITEDGKFWLITLSFPDPDPPPATFTSLMGATGPSRKYKIFKVDAATGDVKSMKIR